MRRRLGWGADGGAAERAPVRSPRGPGLAGIAAMLAMLAACGGDGVTPGPDPPGNGTGGALILRMFDLGANESGGGGDAMLITDSTGAGQRHVLVDAGPAGQGGTDPGYVAARLEALGIDTLEALVLSHAHTDHFDGMSAVLDQVHVRVFYYNGQVRSFTRYQNLLTQAASDAVRVRVSFATDLNLGMSSATRIRILPPLGTYLNDPNAESAEINNGSLGTLLTRGAFSLFIAGDGEVEANERWRTAFATETRNVTALKVGHHGANDAVFDNGASGASLWLAHTSPALQLISSNGTTHPRIRALAALLAQNTTTYCTSVHGDITVRIDNAGANWAVSVQRNAGAPCVPGSEATT